jgi:hypothetical protein
MSSRRNNRVTKSYLIKQGTFDEANLVIDKPEQHNFKNATTITSKIYYKDENGDLCIPFVEGDEVYTFGVNAKYPFDTAKDEQTPDKIIGYHVYIAMTTLDTVANPTQNELYTMAWVDALTNKTKEMSQDPSVLEELPKGVQKLLVPNKDGEIDGVKPLFAYPKMPDPTDARGQRQIFDESKPKRSYIRLIYNSKTKKVNTVFFDEQGDEVNPLQYTDVKGYIKPIYRFDEVYWGTHGTTEFGASIKVSILQADYRPETTKSVPKERLLGQKNAPIAPPIHREPLHEEEQEPLQEETSAARQLIEASKAAQSKKIKPGTKKKTTA